MSKFDKYKRKACPPRWREEMDRTSMGAVRRSKRAMSESFGEAVSKTRVSDRDRDIFLLAYSASLSLFKLGTEYELYDDDLFKRVVEKLEKIKCMTSETYDEIARGISAAYEQEEEQDDE